MNINPPFYLAFPLANPFNLVCPRCGKPIKMTLIFSFSIWFSVKGLPKQCCYRESIRHVFAILFFSTLFILSSIVYLNYRDIIIFLILSLWFSLLICYDIKYYLLPDYLTFSLFLMGLIVCHYDPITLGVWLALCNSGVVFLILWVINAVFYRYRNEYGLGFGDIKLVSALATWFSLIQILHILILASLTALLWIIIIWFVNRKTLLKIPFGPFILFGAWIILLYN